MLRFIKEIKNDTNKMSYSISRSQDLNESGAAFQENMIHHNKLTSTARKSGAQND